MSVECCVNCETQKVPSATSRWTKCPNKNCVAFDEPKASACYRTIPNQHDRLNFFWSWVVPAVLAAGSLFCTGMAWQSLMVHDTPNRWWVGGALILSVTFYGFQHRVRGPAS